MLQLFTHAIGISLFDIKIILRKNLILYMLKSFQSLPIVRIEKETYPRVEGLDFNLLMLLYAQGKICDIWLCLFQRLLVIYAQGKIV